MRLIIRILVNAAALWVAAQIVDGIDLSGNIWAILLVALIFGVVNAIIKPIVKLFSLPMLILTLGLFALVINAAMLALTAALTDNLSVDGFIPAVLGALVISVVSAVLSWLIPDD
ncbi:MAG TPA: phage holin family protein [Acidimicrobiia bacterium]|nr:phage holin family protein [Acidimicrobiia bacterium]